MKAVTDGRMKCFLCGKDLMAGDNIGFVCVCDRCLELWEKTEARSVDMIVALREEIAS